MEPIFSKYQKAIFEWIKDGSGNAIVLATAGSGKSFTIKHAVTDVIENPEDAILVAFNKHIADSLKESMARAGSKATASTTHSVGNMSVNAWARTLGYDRANLDADKYFKITKELLKETKPFSELGKRDFYEVQKAIMDLTNLARLTLVPPTNEGFDLIRRKQSLEIPTIMMPSLKSYSAKLFGYKGVLEDGVAEPTRVPTSDDDDDEDQLIDKSLIYEMARQVMMKGMQKAEKEAIIDFTDQLYLPIILNLPVRQYSWVFSDESQDYSNVQRELILRMMKKGGRVIAVGDRNQAIMGFAGAATDSMDQFKRALNAIEMPLSICYRLPVKHILMAKVYDPTIESRPNAPDGEITWSTMDTFIKLAQKGDLIMCRTTAPLVVACIKFIASGVAARVRGKKIGEGLVSVIEKIAAQDKFEMKKFSVFMSSYVEMQTRRLTREEGNEEQVSILHDKVEAIYACYKRYSVTTDEPNLQAFTNSVSTLFADDKENPPIELSSIHRAKGLESNRAFLLNFQKMPHAWPNITDEQYRQERNLTFVGLTRAKLELVLVTELKEQWDTEMVDKLLAEAREAMQNDPEAFKPEIEKQEPVMRTDPFELTMTIDRAERGHETVIVDKTPAPIPDGVMSVHSQGADEIIKQAKMYQRLSEINRDYEREKKEKEEKMLEDVDRHVQDVLNAKLTADIDRTMEPTPPHLKQEFSKLLDESIDKETGGVDGKTLLNKLSNMELDFGDDEDVATDADKS